YDSVYLYNPFESQRFGGGFARAAGGAGGAEQVAATEARPAAPAPRTPGGAVPRLGRRVAAGVAPARARGSGGGELALWIKRAGPGPYAAPGGRRARSRPR